MITAVDTNVLLDPLTDSAFAEQSTLALEAASLSGALIISEVVYSELSAYYRGREGVDQFLQESGVRLQRSSDATLRLAGAAWRDYVDRRPTAPVCVKCGSPVRAQCSRCGTALRFRQHLVGDFLIGAHAATHADRLLTRDSSYYRTYFPALEIL